VVHCERHGALGWYEKVMDAIERRSDHLNEFRCAVTVYELVAVLP
jgi:hypothetical protein